MNRNIAIGILALTTIVFGGLYVSRPPVVVIQPVDSGYTVGATSGTYHTNAEQFVNTVQLGCAKIYQMGATTNASTSYYLVASTTLSGGFGYIAIVTSTKPTNCP